MTEPDSLESTGVAFVFQGGGSLAAPQVGALWALTEAGIVPDLVVGSSAGALNAVAFAADPTSAGLDRLQALWMSLRRRNVAPISVRTLLGGLTGRGDGLISNAGLRHELVQSGLVPFSLRETTVAAHVVATDLATGEPVVLSNGATIPALLASCAFPGLYPPVELGGLTLVDGGVSADVPVLQAETLGATVTYVLPAATSDDTSRPHGPLGMAYHALGQILESAARRDAAAAHGEVHTLPVPSSEATNPVDFRGTARLIEDAYRLTTEWLSTNLATTGPFAATSSPDSSDSGQFSSAV